MSRFVSRQIVLAGLASIVLLSGCAATVDRSASGSGGAAGSAASVALQVPPAALKKLVLVFNATGGFPKDAG
jgi:hypothetical protein